MHFLGVHSCIITSLLFVFRMEFLFFHALCDYELAFNLNADICIRAIALYYSYRDVSMAILSR